MSGAHGTPIAAAREKASGKNIVYIARVVVSVVSFQEYCNALPPFGGGKGVSGVREAVQSLCLVC